MKLWRKVIRNWHLIGEKYFNYLKEVWEEEVESIYKFSSISFETQFESLPFSPTHSYFPTSIKLFVLFLFILFICYFILFII